MQKLHCFIIIFIFVAAIVSVSKTAVFNDEGRYFDQPVISNFAGYCSFLTHEALFDIRGNYLGHSLMRTAPGIYRACPKSADFWKSVFTLVYL